MTLIWGAHKQNPSLTALLGRWHAREEWVADALEAIGARPLDYRNGRESVPLIAAGALDVTGTGATPPLFAQTMGVDAVLLAVSAPRRESGGLVVRRDSGITSVEQLCGRSIAVMPASWHYQLLIVALRQHGVQWRDVTVLPIHPVPTVEAMRLGRLDAAILSGAPYEALAAQEQIEVLVPASSFSNRSAFWSTQQAVDRAPQEISEFLSLLDRSDRMLPDDVDRAAAVLGQSPEAARRLVTGRTWGLEPVGEDFLAEAQAHGEWLYEDGALEAPVDINRMRLKEGTLTW